MEAPCGLRLRFRPELIGIDWAVVLGFVRLMSSPQVTTTPQRPEDLLTRVSALLARPSVRLVTPGLRHAAIELDAVLATNDADFARFPQLRRVNPLQADTR